MPELLLVTHEHVGTCLLKTAEAIVGKPLEQIICVDVPMDADTDDIFTHTRQHIAEHDTLILTDLYGGTPGNVAMQLAGQAHCRAVSGLNLPMLLRVINYQQQPLNNLVDIALDGGKNGIIHD